MGKILRRLPAILLVGYPAVVWWVVQEGHFNALFAFLAGILLLQAISLGLRNLRSYISLLVLVVISLVAWLSSPLNGVLYYPVWVSAILFVVFVASLLHPPAIITRIALAMGDDLSAAAISYTERVTVAWALFFAGNGVIAWWTVQTNDMALWTLYNGLISYVLMGILMAAEWSIRRVVKHRH